MEDGIKYNECDIDKKQEDGQYSDLPATLLILIALVQGLLLLLLHQAIELDFWPKQSPHWLFCFYSMAFSAPLLYLLTLKCQQDFWQVSRWIVPLSLLLAVLGFYIGYQATPVEHIRYDSLLFSFILTSVLALFKILLYVQHFTSGESFTYQQLFIRSWRNFLTLSLSLTFAGATFAVLMLWAALFKAIQIDFFYEVFTEAWFYYPVIAIAHGFGIIMFRKLSHIIDVIKRIQQTLMKFLLVLIVFVAIIFLVGLLISGLTPLWDSGGSSLILWMQALTLFFVNAVYQNHASDRPYTLWLHRFIYIGVALLPIYSLISFYGLSLRIEQYGLSLARCWGLLVWFLLACFSVGYLWGIIKLKDHWLAQLSRVNVVMGLVLLAFMLLINSPLLDFRKLVVASQMQRLEQGLVKPEDFDVRYFRNELARPGYIALQSLKTSFPDQTTLVAKINRLYHPEKSDSAILYQDFVNSIKIVGDGNNNTGQMTTLPQALTKSIFAQLNQSEWRMLNNLGYYILPVDADQDGHLDYLFIEHNKHSQLISLYFYDQQTWQQVSTQYFYLKGDESIVWLEKIKQGQIDLIRPRWPHIKVGNAEYQLK